MYDIFVTTRYSTVDFDQVNANWLVSILDHSKTRLVNVLIVGRRLLLLNFISGLGLPRALKKAIL